MGIHSDLVNQTKKYKGELHEFSLSMTQWRKFKTKYKLTWQKTRFDEANHVHIPKERGIYAFTVELSPSKLPQHGYILYVGITGDTSAATLHSRYRQYVANLKKEDGRPAVFFMLKNWSGDLFFNYVPLAGSSVDLSKMEKSLLSAVIPPVNKRDIEATITAAKAAAF
ncbi:hypothetical protein [Mesorhizobium sp. M7A.F.Ca.US.010.02.1.1]|uniref:hypothetical protein n=1 Tax=Mesorhizobium sp. M7A.F.Ca.US.010.02.1.1 TaxID=2496743 RepID=UPI000FD3E301|nr:hypothetical protein [Mesorhizobium sp. M7A.F.Ca.US.010.02.1.1]RUW90244.1 hypothetical protein EOA19_21255 [Mesorhizobium sp. M7A.F.Ca.US.010.02.1.1]